MKFSLPCLVMMLANMAFVHSTCDNPFTNFNTDQQEEIVNAHNDIRRQIPATDMNALKWNEQLADKAQELTDTCVFQHDILRTCADKPLGQNMWKGTGFPSASSLNFTGIVNAWGSEEQYYGYDYDVSGTLGQLPGYSWSKVGHFTQVAWAKSRQIGCGYTQCGSAFIVACDYWPTGNYPSQVAYIEGSMADRCSNCKTGYACVNYLCELSSRKRRSDSDEEGEDPYVPPETSSIEEE
jgi:hypothetical protein